MRKLLRCYAERHQGRWEAFCVDFDIAVQASSFEEVYHQLNVAVTDYIENVSTNCLHKTANGSCVGALRSGRGCDFICLSLRSTPVNRQR